MEGTGIEVKNCAGVAAMGATPAGLKGVQVVAVVFDDRLNAKEYNYFAPSSAKAGEYAVVYTNSSQPSGMNANDFPFKVVKIVRDSVVDLEGRANKAIWSSFDSSFAEEMQKRSERLATVKAQLELKKRQFQEREMFAMMAQSDPEVAALLSELSAF
jgi:hypothetical protein